MEEIDKAYTELVEKFAKLDEKGVTRMALKSKNSQAVAHFVANCRLLGYDTETDYDKEGDAFVVRLQL